MRDARELPIPHRPSTEVERRMALALEISPEQVGAILNLFMDAFRGPAGDTEGETYVMMAQTLGVPVEDVDAFMALFEGTMIDVEAEGLLSTPRDFLGG